MAFSQEEKKKLVSHACEENKATDILKDLFKNPKAGSRDEFDLLNKAILREQGKTKDKSNLLLSTNRVRYLFANYINSCRNADYLSVAIKTFDESEGPHLGRQAYDMVLKKAQDDQLHFKRQLDSLIDDKGYPSSWKDLFTEHSKIQIENGPPCFDRWVVADFRTQAYVDHLRHIRLRDEIWGKNSFEDACEEDAKSWHWWYIYDDE